MDEQYRIDKLTGFKIHNENYEKRNNIDKNYITIDRYNNLKQKPTEKSSTELYYNK